MLAIRAVVRQSDGSTRMVKRVAASLDGFRDGIEGEGGTLLRVLSADKADDGPQTLSRRELIDFLEGLSTLVVAGLTLQQALDVAATLPGSPRVALATGAVREDLRKGIQFSLSLGLRIRGLPPLVSGLAGIGEATGRLDQVLPPLVAYLRQSHRLREKLVSASLYPALILALGFGGVIALMTLFIPQLERSLLSGNAAMAEGLRDGFSSLRAILGVIGAVLAAPIVALAAYRLARRRNPAAAARIERLLFRVPAAGAVARTSQLLGLSFSLELLGQNNIRLDDALGQAARSLWSVALGDLAVSAAQAVRQGVPLSRALSQGGILPAHFLRWIQIAEQTGKPAQAFSQLRLFFERELDRQLSRVMALIEPLLIALIGAVMIAAIVTVVLPLFSVYSGGLK
jgi:general secretion pathway protein F